MPFSTINPQKKDHPDERLPPPPPPPLLKAPFVWKLSLKSILPHLRKKNNNSSKIILSPCFILVHVIRVLSSCFSPRYQTLFESTLPLWGISNTWSTFSSGFTQWSSAWKTVKMAKYFMFPFHTEVVYPEDHKADQKKKKKSPPKRYDL